VYQRIIEASTVEICPVKQNCRGHFAHALAGFGWCCLGKNEGT
jgi:hypothetical protein